jgi:hypothetical protein
MDIINQSKPVAIMRKPPFRIVLTEYQPVFGS